MTEPDASRPSGSHRRTDGTNNLVVLIASLVAIAIVAFLVVFALHKRGEPASRNAPASASKTTSQPATTASGLVSPSSASSSASRSTVSTASPSSAGPAPKSSASPSTPAVTRSPSGQGPTPAIDVLNDSRITGLAAQAAAQFRAAGWDVASTGNFRGSDVPATTIFYPAGERAAAERLAAAFRIRRVLPAPAGLSASHLTVVVARDWANRG